MRSRSLRGARILVTGGEGFLGARLIPMLARAGARVLSVGQGPPPAFRGGVEARRLRLDREGELRRALRGHAFEYVVHLAAMTRGGPERAPDFVTHNLIGTANLLAEVGKMAPPPRRFVLAGTVDEFGLGRAPYGPDSPVRPVSVYAATKAGAALLARALCGAWGVPLTELKFTLLYGPGQRADMFLPALVRAMVAGETFAMTLGEQTRDFLHADDASRAILAALRRGEDADRRYVIAAGRAVPVARVARRVRDMTGRRGTLKMGALPYREPEMWDGRGDASRARRELGWKPRVALEAGLRDLIRRARRGSE